MWPFETPTKLRDKAKGALTHFLRRGHVTAVELQDYARTTDARKMISRWARSGHVTHSLWEKNYNTGGRYKRHYLKG